MSDITQLLEEYAAAWHEIGRYCGWHVEDLAADEKNKALKSSLLDAYRQLQEERDRLRAALQGVLKIAGSGHWALIVFTHSVLHEPGGCPDCKRAQDDLDRLDQARRALEGVSEGAG